MKSDSLSLLPLTVYGTPSGNYDGSSDTSFSGDRQKAAGYYRTPNAGLQSVRFQTSALVGTIAIEASLDENPTTDAHWFTVYTFESDSSMDPIDQSVSFTGNFAWMRATVSGFEAGTITAVTLSY